jgi:hypothetical protein
VNCFDESDGVRKRGKSAFGVVWPGGIESTLVVVVDAAVDSQTHAEFESDVDVDADDDDVETPRIHVEYESEGMVERCARERRVDAQRTGCAARSRRGSRLMEP